MINAEASGPKKMHAVPFYIIPEVEGNVIFHSKSSTLRLKASAAGQIVELVLPMLDGTRSRNEIVEELASALSPERTMAFIDQLQKHGFVKSTDAPPDTVASEMVPRLESIRRYLAGEEDSGWAAVATLRSAHVAIVNRGSLSAALLNGLLHAGVGRITMLGGDAITETEVSRVQFLDTADIGRPWGEVLAERLPFNKFGTSFQHQAMVPDSEEEWAQALDGVSMVAAVIDGPSYFQRCYADLNRAALRSRTPWMIVGNVQKIGLAVGPTFIPGSTPCLACFEARLKSNLNNVQMMELLEQYTSKGGKHVEFGEIAPGIDVAANLACLEIVDTLVEGRLAKTAGKLLTVDLASYGLALHNVLRLPRCPVCRPGAKAVSTRIWA